MDYRMFASQCQRICVKCSSPAELMCGRCFDSYCSRECQISDWMQHKHVCKVMPNLVRLSMDHSIDKATACKGEDLDNKHNEEKPCSPRPELSDITVLLKSPQSVKHLQTATKMELTPLQPKKIQKTLKSNSGQKKENLLKVMSTNSTIKNFEDTPSEDDDFGEMLMETQSKVSSRKLYTHDDIKLIPLRVGKNMSLVVIDFSFINQFVISAADFNCSDRIELTKNLSKIADYCKTAAKNNKGFHPTPSELFLSIYDADGEWYRAYSLAEKDDNGEYPVQFIDYGNIATVSSASIMPITEELLFPTCVNTCRIVNLKAKDIPKFKAAIETSGIIQCDVSYVEKYNIFEVSIHNLEKLFE